MRVAGHDVNLSLLFALLAGLYLLLSFTTGESRSAEVIGAVACALVCKVSAEVRELRNEIRERDRT